MNKGDIIVRDVRTKSHFIVDDEYLNGFAKVCGASASMVYLCLCRHADQGQKAFPSIKLMSEKLGVDPRTIRRGIDILVAHNIIVKGRQRNPKSGRWWHNAYLLNDKSVWFKEVDHRTLESTGSPQDKLTTYQRTLVSKSTGHSATTKDSHKKDSHIRIGKHLRKSELTREEQQARTAELRRSLTASKKMITELTT